MDTTFMNELGDLTFSESDTLLVKEKDNKTMGQFLKHLYYYYFVGGWYPICVNEFMTLFVWTCQIIFGYVLFFGFNWELMLQCHENCGQITQYIIVEGTLISRMYCFVCLIYWLWLIMRSIFNIQNVYKIHQFVKNKIPDVNNICNYSSNIFYFRFILM